MATAARSTKKRSSKRTTRAPRARKTAAKKPSAKKAAAKRPAKGVGAKRAAKKAAAKRPAKKVVAKKAARTKSATTLAGKRPAKKPAAMKRALARTAGKAPRAGVASASQQISARIAELGDWRGDVLSRVRALIKEADPDVVEEWKWEKPTSGGTPVWSHDGIMCTGESYKSVVKLTFFKGASLPDPARLFNSSLDGKVRRAIDIHEGEEIDEGAFKDLIRAAVALNTTRS